MATKQVKLDQQQTDPASTDLVQKTKQKKNKQKKIFLSLTVKQDLSIRRY